jgi:sugar O-acyltransferase (sialic acid O-acetyltransferase NeuD family)
MNMEIVILGIRGMGVDIADAIEAQAREGRPVRVMGFLDDDPGAQGTTVGGYPVLGRLADVNRFPCALFVNGIGSPTSYRNKASITEAAGLPEERWATVIHPTAVVSPRAKVGAGAVLLAHVCVCAGARVGRHVMVLPNSVISHDTVVHDHVSIASGVCIAGRCDVGASCYLGSNSSIRQDSRIGERALIGMGAVVVGDVPPDSVYLGNPARPHVSTGQ